MLPLSHESGVDEVNKQQQNNVSIRFNDFPLCVMIEVEKQDERKPASLGTMRK